MMGQRLRWVFWPGFVVAIPAVGLFFSIVDPADLQWFGVPLEVSRLGAYTLGFVFFWAIGSGCSGARKTCGSSARRGTTRIAAADSPRKKTAPGTK